MCSRDPFELTLCDYVISLLDFFCWYLLLSVLSVVSKFGLYELHTRKIHLYDMKVNLPLSTGNQAYMTANNLKMNRNNIFSKSENKYVQQNKFRTKTYTTSDI